MPLGRELIGIPVRVDVAGEILGEVVDLCFDRRGRLCAVVVAPQKGLIRRERAVPVTRFTALSEDGAVLGSREALDEAAGVEANTLRLRQGANGLQGRPLIAADGSELGSIADVALEPGTHEIWGFEVSDGTIMDLLEGRSIVDAQGATLAAGKVVLTDLSHMNLGPEGDPTA